MTHPLEISQKTLVMIVGPVAVGKSSLMHAVTQLDHRFGYVRSFTTRPPRENEITTYQHLSLSEVRAKQATGEIVTYIEHPTNGYVYGTTRDSYSSEFNLLDTLAHTVNEYRSLPFQRTVTISLTTPAEAWQKWLVKRYPAQNDEEMQKRVVEAISSIEWSLQQTSHHAWLVNTPDQLETTAEQLVDIVLGARQPQSHPPLQAQELLQTARSLL